MNLTFDQIDDQISSINLINLGITKYLYNENFTDLN